MTEQDKLMDAHLLQLKYPDVSDNDDIKDLFLIGSKDEEIERLQGIIHANNKKMVDLLNQVEALQNLNNDLLKINPNDNTVY